MVARAGNPSLSLAMVSSAAASFAPHALPAVMEKPSISGCGGLSAASFSRVVSRRGCSSVSNNPCGCRSRRSRRRTGPRRWPRSPCGASRNAHRSISSRLTPALTAAFQPTVIDMSMFGASGRSGWVGGNQFTQSASLALPTARMNLGEVEAEFTPPARITAGPYQRGYLRPRLHRGLARCAVPVVGEAGHRGRSAPLESAPRSVSRAARPASSAITAEVRVARWIHRARPLRLRFPENQRDPRPAPADVEQFQWTASTRHAE